MIIRKIKPTKTLLILTLSLFFIFISPFKISGDEFSDYAKKLQDNIAQQAALQKQIDDSVKQERDLAGQIAYMDNQIKLTTLKIEETETTIERLGLDILSLTDRLGKLQSQLENLVTISNQRIRLIHEQTFVNPMAETLLNTRGIDDFIMRTQYLAYIRKNDIRVLGQLQSTKTNYNDQKDLLSQKKKQQEDLKAKSIAQKASLDTQKKAKDELLRVTKNNEENYRSELNRLKADAAAIAAALSNVGIKVGDVKKGEFIAIQGNTGCVAPPPPAGHHLHLEAYQNARVVGGAVVDINTGKSIQFKLTEHLVNPRPYLDSGQWAKPIAIYPNNITTEFMETSVFGTPHTGLDIAGPITSPLFAVDNGEVYLAYGGVCDAQMGYKSGTTSPARGRIIDHQNGFVTLYWHTSN